MAWYYFAATGVHEAISTSISSCQPIYTVPHWFCVWQAFETHCLRHSCWRSASFLWLRFVSKPLTSRVMARRTNAWLWKCHCVHMKIWVVVSTSRWNCWCLRHRLYAYCWAYVYCCLDSWLRKDVIDPFFLSNWWYSIWIFCFANYLFSWSFALYLAIQFMDGSFVAIWRKEFGQFHR